MQFTRAFVALATFVTFAAATPLSGDSTPAPIPASQCNTGPIQCCNTVQRADSPAVAPAPRDITALVGATCSPISVIGLPGNSCNAQPVCCSNNTFNGLIAIGCVPIIINL
ncbi:fungal hydrophobin [Coprinellus micaceus]|uniref:Hydrophobin n=1 Tax=Coprinellus micaceus TaxID=71717 RepID=A0A4Y7SN19_COPMI|nr:fungal hydrophobin [Coprinellus micaceus]